MNKYTNAFQQVFFDKNNSLLFFAVVFGTFFASLVLSNFLADILLKFVVLIFSKSKFNLDKDDLSPAKKPLKTFFVATATFLAIYFFANAKIEQNSSFIVLLSFARKIYRVIMILIITSIIYSIVPALFRLYKRLSKSESLSPVVSLFAERALRLFVIVICFIVILSEFGINVNGLITGLGLGGLTFALAAQDTASNIFGGVVILSDKPFAVGDWIQTPEAEGIVEDITFRSTRIRTFEDALIILPNNKISSSPITNLTKMNKRRIRFNLGLTYTTKPEKLRIIIDEIRDALKNHKETISDSVMVRLQEFAPSSFEIFVQAYINKLSQEDLKRIREEINYEIIDIVARNESSFAFPSTSVYVEKMFVQE
ncbi:MAG: mechanosensitive ion channel family protein [Peptostreptococcaceae bacterium]|nr:mechanosensitive ion channel family protein [Peptostreptococcaceae bacterium]